MNKDYLKQLDQLVEQKYLRKVEDEYYVQYCYTEKCTYESYWNEYTRNSRGNIYDKTNGELVAKAFSKFFNLNEKEETKIENLPNEPYEVYEKIDGSLGIIYYCWYRKKWMVNTKCSFNSEQSIKAEQILYNKYKINHLNPWTTYLCEIIYPENKIVVDYKNKEELVLLGEYYIGNRDSIIELPNDFLESGSHFHKIPFINPLKSTVFECIQNKKTLSKDKEGYVIRYKNGLRVKIKGEEYLKIHKIKSNLTPIAVWEVMENGRVPQTYLQEIPEELLPEINPIKEALESEYLKYRNEIIIEIGYIEINGLSREEIGLNEFKHKTAIFAFLDKKCYNTYIMKLIRPKKINLSYWSNCGFYKDSTATAWN